MGRFCFIYIGIVDLNNFAMACSNLAFIWCRSIIIITFRLIIYVVTNMHLRVNRTTTACSGVLNYVDSTWFTLETEHCQEGESKVEDCNNCNCTNGVWSCTRKLCSKKRGNYLTLFKTLWKNGMLKINSGTQKITVMMHVKVTSIITGF